MDKLLIGTVLKPQGIRGELKIKNYTDDFYAISALKEVFIDGVSYQVLKMRCDKDVFILLRGIADRNDAELFRNKDIYALKADVRRKKNTYFICDVIGCSVLFEDGTVFGKIEEILSARTDIYYISTPEGRVIAPWLKSYQANFDIENRTVTVNKEEFLKEINYEN
ncbi:MAG: 16S rRNA processing protein RimM [Clostridiales bacterium]|nr:16S rRNA processing protein RimM [Clostridiales bacterium]